MNATEEKQTLSRPVKSTPRSEETRRRIYEAALQLFRAKGFAAATMRDIATEADVAVGLAYYYFKTKEDFVLAFYQQAIAELPQLLEPAHAEGLPLEDRLVKFLEAKFAYFAPNRNFLGALMGFAADPNHPLSPFHESSQSIREFDFAQFARMLEETGTRIPKDLAPHMPAVLWLYQLGILLFWIYDSSPQELRSRGVLKKSAQIVNFLIRTAGLPMMRPVRKPVVELIELIRSR